MYNSSWLGKLLQTPHSLHWVYEQVFLTVKMKKFKLFSSSDIHVHAAVAAVVELKTLEKTAPTIWSAQSATVDKFDSC